MAGFMAEPTVSQTYVSPQMTEPTVSQNYVVPPDRINGVMHFKILIIFEVDIHKYLTDILFEEFTFLCNTLSFMCVPLPCLLVPCHILPCYVPCRTLSYLVVRHLGTPCCAYFV